MVNPLGKYSDLVTAIVTAFLVVVAVLSHVLIPAEVSADLTFVDAAALLALGRIYGQQSAANGYAQMAISANRRVDVIEARTGINTHPPATPGDVG